MKNERGITLIALIITIIVMLILVSVTIRVSTNGKLFSHAANAVSQTKDAIATENSILEGKIKIGNTTYDSIDEYVSMLTSTPHYGDANEDGVVNINDANRIYDFISGIKPTPQQKMNSDLDTNGIIEQRDYDILINYLDGKVTELPYTGELPE